ncbi:hypothetical protein T484DRAFT_1792670, partial [Baffinella frigidus]
VSHHPPVSAFHFVNRKGGWLMNVALRPKSKFLGNSAASIMEGTGTLHDLVHNVSDGLHTISTFMGNSAASIMEGTGTLHDLVHKETYDITFPSYYVRGLLIG